MVWTRLGLLTLSLVLTACGGGGGGGGSSETTSNGAVAVSKRLIEANATCPNGGVEIDMGVDTNKNGQLDADEISSTETICHGTTGTSAAVRLTSSTDASCPFGGTNIDVGVDTNANGTLDDAEVLDTSLICHAQSSVVADDFALSAKGKVAGQLDLALIPTPKSIDGFSVQSRSRSITSRKVTSQAGTLWLTPNDIAAAIQADQAALDQANNNPGSDTQITPPVIAPIEIPVAADGSYSIDVPAGTDYSLTYVSDDATQAIKIDDVNVTPNQETTVSIGQQDLIPAGAVNFVVQSLASNTPLENATVTLLNDATSTTTDASGLASFEGLAQGSYLLLVEQTGFVSQTFAAQTNSGVTLDMGVLQLNSEKGTASGTLTVDTELLTSLDNIVVYARDSRGGIYTTLTDSNGAFSFNALPAANGYSFIVQANDFSADKIDSVNINANANASVGSIQLKPSSAFVGSISGFAKFFDKLGVLNAHAGLLVAVEGTDKEAVTSRDGAFVLNGLAPGRYTLNFTDSNYQTTTLENIRVVATATTSLDPVTLDLRQGQVSGVVSLDGQLSSAGILVEILGTNSKTFTDNSGRWFLNLPTGNYGNGIRYSANLFESKTANETITVTENGEYQADAQVLAQQGKQLKLDLSALGGECSALQVALSGTSGAANGYSALFTVGGGQVEKDLLFGDYTLTATCVDDGFETVVKTLTLEAGNGLITTLEPIALRVSYITINDGAQYTNNANVTLAIGAVGASEMQIIQGTFDSDWITLADTYALALEAGDGYKTVLIHLRDAAQQPLSDVSASIELDTTITVASFTATGATTKNDTLHLRLDLSGEIDATVTADIPGLITGLAMFDNGLNGDVNASDGIYERNLEIATPNEITATVTANITDRAGNTASQDAAAGIVLSTSPSISAVSVVSNVASGEMTIGFSTDEPATSDINYGDAADNLATNLPVKVTLTQNHSITLTGLPANQLTFFQLVATDAASNVGNFNGEGKLAPAPIDGLNAAAGSAEVGLVWGESTHNELAGYNLYRSADGGASFTLLNTAGVISERYLVDSSASNETTYQYKVTVLDHDGNESIASGVVEATPSSTLAGPTEMNGGVIATDTIWLSSRSPYNIIDNVLVRDDASLLMMAGTQVQFVGAAKHILVKGAIQAYGSAENNVVIASDPNVPTDTYDTYVDLSSIKYESGAQTHWRHVQWNFVNSTYNNGNNTADLNIKFSHADIKISFRMAFQYVDSIEDSQMTFHNCEQAYNVAAIGSISRSQISVLPELIEAGTCTDPATSDDTNLQASVHSIGTLDGVTANWVRLTTTIGVTNSTFHNVFLYSENYNGSYIIADSDFTQSKISANINNKLKMRRNTLDVTSRITGGQLDISANYWGTTDIAVIGDMTGYIPNPENDTHLYPIITSSDLENADWDNDGIPDIRDHDNDNDGYSDLQEDWSSDPAYGSIYNPLDANSFPPDDIDTDMDGIADTTDTDDDNDKLSDTDETVYGTNPLLADSDNDGSLDGDEISRKYDPLDGNNFPYLGNVSGITIDGTNVNSDGWVFFGGSNVTLTGVTVAAGSRLMVDRDTQLVINDSNLLGKQNNPIYLRTTGNGSGSVTFNSSQMTFANIKSAISISFNSKSTVSRSDLSIYSLTMYSQSSLHDSFVTGPQGMYIDNNSLLMHSYVYTNSSINVYGEARSIRQAGEMGGVSAGSGGVLADSVVNTMSNGSGAITGSIIHQYYGGTNSVQDSDVALVPYDITWSDFFDGVYLTTIGGGAFYDGLGTPTDLIGDGVAATVFTLGSYTYTVDGIKNPRSTPHFPNGESDLWNPDGVGALWDKNDPDTFPDPLAP